MQQNLLYIYRWKMVYVRFIKRAFVCVWIFPISFDMCAYMSGWVYVCIYIYLVNDDLLEKASNSYRV